MMNSPPCILTMLLVRGKSGGSATFSLSEYLRAPSGGLPSDAARLDEQPQEVLDLTTQKEDDTVITGILYLINLQDPKQIKYPT
jgi:hypothetical protein